MYICTNIYNICFIYCICKLSIGLGWDLQIKFFFGPQFYQGWPLPHMSRYASRIPSPLTLPAMRENVPRPCSGAAPGSRGRHAWNTSRGNTYGHPIQMPEPPQLSHLDVEEQQLYSKLLLVGRAPHPISKGALHHPVLARFILFLYPASCFFGCEPKFMTIGRNVGSPVNYFDNAAFMDLNAIQYCQSVGKS